jgi:hypothetical protein
MFTGGPGGGGVGYDNSSTGIKSTVHGRNWPKQTLPVNSNNCRWRWFHWMMSSGQTNVLVLFMFSKKHGFAPDVLHWMEFMGHEIESLPSTRRQGNAFPCCLIFRIFIFRCFSGHRGRRIGRLRANSSAKFFSRSPFCQSTLSVSKFALKRFKTEIWNTI